MKIIASIVLAFLLCTVTICSAFAANGCGNEHYFTCGGGVGNDGREYHNPGTNQKFKCYAHSTTKNPGATSSVCTKNPLCRTTPGTIWHSYKCMKCSYGSDGSYQTDYKPTTVHSICK